MTPGRFDRDKLPDWPAYADHAGLKLVGRGRWRTTECQIHGGSDSLRVNTASGGWICMACGAKGGDVLAHYMQRTSVSFVQAARDLGAWVEGQATGTATAPHKPLPFSARDALESISLELHVVFVVISDARRGVLPNDADWKRFLDAAARVLFVADKVAA